MSEQTKIQWCDHTFNPWIGCTKISPGCAKCYAETLDKNRFSKTLGGGTKENPVSHWGKGAPRLRTSVSNWKEPLKWNRQTICVTCGEPQAMAVANDEGCDNPDCDSYLSEHFVSAYRRPRVFCASLADWLDDEVPIEWLADLLKLIHDTPNLDWLLLTKRPENFFMLLEEAWKAKHETLNEEDEMVEGWLFDDKAPENVWIGTSVEDQQRADERIPSLLKIPAKIRFLSVEPMLSPISFGCTCWFSHNTGPNSECEKCGKRRMLSGIQWAIFGGESGPGAGPCNIEWIRSGVKQCQAAGVSPFVKQVGSYPIGSWPMAGKDGASGVVDLRKAGRLSAHELNLPPFKDKKGGEMSEWPEDLRIREFPKNH